MLAAASSSHAHGQSQTSQPVTRALAFVALAFGALVMVAPLFVALSISLSPADKVFTYPPELIPETIHPENYLVIMNKLNFGRYLLNSFVVTIIATISVTATSAMAGYAFARLRFFGSGALFTMILLTVMIPIQVTTIPLYILFKSVPFAGGNDWAGSGGIGWLNSYPGLIIPFAGSTFGVFLLRQYFQVMPRSLIEAGRIDGCSEFKIFRRIYLPLAKPALATVAILTFTEVWNAFLWPLIVINSPQMRTLQVGLSSLRGQYFADWHLLMAGVVLTATPPLVVFLLGQKYFARGVAMTGLKG